METIPLELARKQLAGVLREAVDGPPERWSYFTDNSPDAGYVGTIGKLDAALASRLIGGTSIASHVYHAIFAMEASAKWIRGDKSPRDWKKSWSVSAVDDAAWSSLKSRLRDVSQDLRSAIESSTLSDADSLGGAIGALAHLGYHLGAIRQKIAFAGKLP